uniref:Uncharacterized protein n=1 Tax=Setaria viridis TaxID=4556 RepID=A0A4U6WHG0_SETVI|nr:hypothetical protein SEVIR_1G374950v2 [Setaria viridis]
MQRGGASPCTSSAGLFAAKTSVSSCMYACMYVPCIGDQQDILQNRMVTCKDTMRPTFVKKHPDPHIEQG